jgi:hypothetical protein
LGSIDNIFFEAIYSDYTKRYLDIAEMFLKTVTRSKICAAICCPILEFIIYDYIGKEGKGLYFWKSQAKIRSK